jgi:hypothetical protein
MASLPRRRLVRDGGSRHQIELLLIVTAERGARLLPDDSQHRHMIHAGVVKTGDQMRGPSV